MRGIGRALRSSSHGGGSQARIFVTDTLNVVRRWYLVSWIATLVLAMLIGDIFGGTTLGSNIAAYIAMLGVIVCGTASYFFGARIVLGAFMYKAVKRLLFHKFRALSPHDRKPNLLNLWYWQAFIAMWATTPHAALAILRPWEGGRSFQLIFAIYMLLHVVATQREIGKFWRRVYATTTTAILATMIFAIVNPGDWERIKGTHQRGQNLSFAEEAYQGTIGDKLIDQKRVVDAELANVSVEINDLLASGVPVPDSLNDKEARLKVVRSRIEHQVETQSNWVGNMFGWLPNPTDADESTMATLMGGCLILGVALLVATHEKKKH